MSQKIHFTVKANEQFRCSQKNTEDVYLERISLRNKKNNVIATSENKLVFSEERNALFRRFSEKSYNYVAFINDIIMIVLYLIHRK